LIGTRSANSIRAGGHTHRIERLDIRPHLTIPPDPHPTPPQAEAAHL
jgi:hypothetical protein